MAGKKVIQLNGIKGGGGKRFVHALRNWYLSAARDLPWRGISNPYEILVSEIMLQQTQVATVKERYTRWLTRFPDEAALASAREEEVLREWEGLGYYNRARNLQRAARAVVEEFGGKWPGDRRGLGKLPGIGRYTASAVASFAFGESVGVLDANVSRVLSRLLDCRDPVDTAPVQAALQQKADHLASASPDPALHNNAMMELGALVCRSGTPDCTRCPVRSHCRTENPKSLPAKRAKPTVIKRDDACMLCVRADMILLEQVGQRRWKGMWRLPPAPSPTATPAVLEMPYAVTRYRMTLKIHRMDPPACCIPPLRWIPVADIDRLPMPSPYRRALRRLGLSREESGCQSDRRHAHSPQNGS